MAVAGHGRGSVGPAADSNTVTVRSQQLTLPLHHNNTTVTVDLDIQYPVSANHVHQSASNGGDSSAISGMESVEQNDEMATNLHSSNPLGTSSKYIGHTFQFGGIPWQVPSPDSPPPLTPGSSCSSSTCSSRCSTPDPDPLTPGAASVSLSPIVVGDRGTGSLDQKGKQYGHDVHILSEDGTQCQPASLTSPSNSWADLQLGIDCPKVGIESRDKQARYPGLVGTETSEREHQIMAERDQVGSLMVEAACSVCQQDMGESSYLFKKKNVGRQLSQKKMILTENNSKTLPVQDRNFLVENDISNSLLDLVGHTKLCSNCKSCKRCGEDRQFISSKEAEEQLLYQDQITYNKAEQRMETDWLWCDVSRHGCYLGQYTDHKEASLSRNKRMEAKLLRDYDQTSISHFNSEMADRFLKGEFLTYQQCMEIYEDFSSLPKYYSPIYYAKSTKVSHPIRPIFDTSLSSKQSKNLCFNSFLLNGPALNTNLLHSFFTTRNFRNLGISDIGKYFNSIKIRKKSQCLCSFSWRVNPENPGVNDGIGSNFEWSSCVATRLEFGQKASPFLAGECLSTATKLFCKDQENIDGQQTSIYVDDYMIFSDQVGKLYARIGDLVENLALANFRFKQWDFTVGARQYWIPQFEDMLKTGALVDDELLKQYEQWKVEGSPPVVSQPEQETPSVNRVKGPEIDRVKDSGSSRSYDVVEGPLEESCKVQKILGSFFCLSLDLFKPAIRMNISQRSRGAKELKYDVTLDNVEKYFSDTFRLTKRKALSLVHSAYDICGFSAPLTFNFKQLYQKLLLDHEHDDSFNYDSELSQLEIANWVSAAKELLLFQEYWFKRPLTIAENADDYEQPHLAGYFDGSSAGCGMCLFYVYPAKDKSHCIGKLIISKACVAGLKECSIPDRELSALLLLATTVDSLTRANVLLKTRESFYIGDSLIVLRLCLRPSVTFGKTLSAKVAKVKSLIDVQRLRWCKSSHNVADIVSKPQATVQQVLSVHYLNCGPLNLPYDEWKVYRPEDPRCQRDVDDDMPQHLLLPPAGRRVLNLEKGQINKVSECDKLNSQSVEGGGTDERKKLECQVSYLKRVNLDVSHMEVWRGLLNKFSLGKVIRILVLCFIFVKMKTKGLTYPEVLLTYPDTKENLIDYLEKQASKVSGLYLRKVKFGLQKNIVYNQTSEKYEYRERFVNPGANYPLQQNVLVFMTLSSAYFRAFLVESHLCFTSDIRILRKIQEKYICRYLLKGLKKVRSACYRCQRREATKRQPIYAKQGALPSFRIQNESPFSFVCLDPSGVKKCEQPSSHVFDPTKPVKDQKEDYSKVINKYYVCNFVCMSSGAINLIGVPSLSTDSIVKAIKIHTNQRGSFKALYSDLYSSLLSTYRQLSQEEEDGKTEDDLIAMSNQTLVGIAGWVMDSGAKFYSPLSKAPWFQGVAENRFRYVNSYVVPKLRVHELDLFDFQAILSDLCVYLNSLPVYLEENSTFSVTRQELLFNCAFRPGFQAPVGKKSRLLEQFQNQQNYQNRFYEFLFASSLRRLLENRTWAHSDAPPLQVNDIVLLPDRVQTASKFYGLGKIKKILPSRDQINRKVEIIYKIFYENKFRSTVRHVNQVILLVSASSGKSAVTIDSIFGPDPESLKKLLEMDDQPPDWNQEGNIPDNDGDRGDDDEVRNDDDDEEDWELVEPQENDEVGRNDDLVQDFEMVEQQSLDDFDHFNDSDDGDDEGPSYHIDGNKDDNYDDDRVGEVDLLSTVSQPVDVTYPGRSKIIKDLPKIITEQVGDPIQVWNSDVDPVQERDLEVMKPEDVVVQDEILDESPYSKPIRRLNLHCSRKLFLKSMLFCSNEHITSTPDNSTEELNAHPSSILVDNKIVVNKRTTEFNSQVPVNYKAKVTAPSCWTNLSHRTSSSEISDSGLSCGAGIWPQNGEVMAPNLSSLSHRTSSSEISDAGWTGGAGSVPQNKTKLNYKKFRSSTIVNLVIKVLVLFQFCSLINISQACWVKHESGPEICESELRPNLVLLTQQYQSFLEAIKNLQEIDKEKVESVNFLGHQAVIYSTEYLDSIKNDFDNNVVPSQYSDIVAHCLKTSLVSVNFR